MAVIKSADILALFLAFYTVFRL